MKSENYIGSIIVDASVHIHKTLGSGLLERVYEQVLTYELEKRNLNTKRQVAIAIQYESLTFEEGFRADILVENKVILEIKAVEHLNNAHKKQLLTYLKLSGCKLGFLLNFSAPIMKEGICRIVHQL